MDDPGGSFIKVVALAGGVGGARLADGLAKLLPPGSLTVIVNIGDDFEHLGLKICPDLDTVCYTLAGLANPETGWGLQNETFHAFEAVKVLGGPDWFRLGDRDLATHLERTRRLGQGESLSQITADFSRRWGVSARILPASDDPAPTIVLVDTGELAFQEYFVHQHCQPRVHGFRFEHVKEAIPAPRVLEALTKADILVICPSNPWVSIDPILAIPGIRPAIMIRKEDLPVVAVSPIIAGKTVKGPAAKMFRELGIEPTALAVAEHYKDFLSGIVIDQQDEAISGQIQKLGVAAHTTDTLMRNPDQRYHLALETLRFGASLSNEPERLHLSGKEAH